LSAEGANNISRFVKGAEMCKSSQFCFGSRSSVRAQRSLRGGVAAVEFALVAPLFFLLVIGVIEVGRALMVQQVLINASRVGARRAVMMSSSEEAVTSAVTEYAAGVGLSGLTVTVSTDPETAEAGTAITVATSVNFNNVNWLPGAKYLGNKILSSSSVMRKEGF
jgi:Flp pilus assembly protein TadG